MTDATSSGAAEEPSPEVAAPTEEHDADASQDTSVQAEDPDAEPSPDEEPDPDLVEVDYKGAKIAVPKAIYEANLRHKDYTEKSQQNAAQRETLRQRETELATREQAVTTRSEQYVKAQDALLDTRAEIKATEGQLAAYDQLITQARQSGDTDHARDLQFNRMELKEALDALRLKEGEHRGTLKTEEQSASTAASEAVQAQIRAGIKHLHEDPNVRLTQESFNQVAAHIEKAFGISSQRLTQALAEPELYRVAMAAALVPKLQAEIAALKKGTSVSAVRPAQTVGSTAGANARKPSDPSGDGLSDDEWLRRRTAELAARSDAERKARFTRA